jgi:RNase H-fold protein (predicted Holliday junction resolvase)
MPGDFVLGIDPGSAKAGYALVDAAGAVLASGIVRVEEIGSAIEPLLATFSIGVLAVGSGTRARSVAAQLIRFGIHIEVVDEFETTRRARELYFIEHPPRGWRRLVPVGMLLPPRPIDDYAAILIARRFLTKG